MYKVPVAGGAPTPMPIDSAVGLATFGPDGHTIAYNRIFRNFRTWKRYNGGLAQQVFTYDFNTRQLTQITDWSGTNTSPMWYGRKIYFLSRPGRAPAREHLGLRPGHQADPRGHPFHRLRHRLPGAGRRRHRLPAGRQALCCSTCRASSCARCRSACRTTIRAPARTSPTSRTRSATPTRPSRSTTPWRPTASARCSRPAATSSACRPRTAPTRDLTGTQGVDEDHPAWSPDGKTIAYTTDVGGGQQIAVRPAEGGPEKRADRVRRAAISTARCSRRTARRWRSATARTGCGWCGIDGGAPQAGGPGQVQRDPRPGVLAGRPLAGLQPGRRPAAGATSISTRSPAAS